MTAELARDFDSQLVATWIDHINVISYSIRFTSCVLILLPKLIDFQVDTQ